MMRRTSSGTYHSDARTVTSWDHAIAIEHTIVYVRNRDHVGGGRLLPQGSPAVKSISATICPTCRV